MRDKELPGLGVAGLAAADPLAGKFFHAFLPNQQHLELVAASHGSDGVPDGGRRQIGALPHPRGGVDDENHRGGELHARDARAFQLEGVFLGADGGSGRADLSGPLAAA